MRKVVCFLFCCLSVWARDIQESKHQFVDENKSFSENLKNLDIPDSFKLEEIVIGDENAPHTLIIYSSFSCNHCCKFHKEELPKLKKQYVDPGKLKIILRNYIDDLGALEAAILMRVFYNKSKDASALYKIIFDAQKDWMESKNPREFLKQTFIRAGYDSKDAIALYKIIFDAQKDWMKSKNPREFLKQTFIRAGYDSKDAIALYKIIFDAQKDWMKSKNPREFLKQTFIRAGYDSKVVANYLDTNNSEYKKISAGLMKEQQRAMHSLQISSVPAFVLDGRVHQGILTSEEIVEKLGINPKF